MSQPLVPWNMTVFGDGVFKDVKVKSLSHIRLFATPWAAAYQAPPSMGVSRQEYWSGVPLPSPCWKRWAVEKHKRHKEVTHQKKCFSSVVDFWHSRAALLFCIWGKDVWVTEMPSMEDCLGPSLFAVFVSAGITVWPWASGMGPWAPCRHLRWVVWFHLAIWEWRPTAGHWRVKGRPLSAEGVLCSGQKTSFVFLAERGSKEAVGCCGSCGG